MTRTSRARAATWLAICLLSVSSLAVSRPCLAETATPAWVDEIAINGFFSFSHSYNFNRPPTRTNSYRVFDTDDDTFRLDEFELVTQHAAVKPRDSGFRVDLTLGSISRVTASAGLFRDEAGTAGDVDVHQAFATWIAPVGSGLRIDAGKFITGHGYEVIDGYDGWNDNATRSFLFGYAIPFTHVGLRGSYVLAPLASASVMLVNGWDVARDNNRRKSIGGQVTLTPRSWLSIIATGMMGPERDDNDTADRELLDLVVIAKPSGRVTLGANADWCRDRKVFDTGQDAQWNGIAGYARVSITSAFALSLRGETFEDPDGVRTGTPQRLDEITATPELRLTPHMLVRADVRVDRSDSRVFPKSAEFVKTQPTAMLQVLYSF